MAEKKLTNKLKLTLYNQLKADPTIFQLDNLMEFLSSVWNLREMQSEDDRFDNAYDDIVQHVINNDDWSFDYLFEERLRLLQDDEIFYKFLESFVSPRFRADEDDIMRYVLLVNSYLEKVNRRLVPVDYNENGLSIHTVQYFDDISEYPKNYRRNTIPFFVQKELRGRSYLIGSHDTPKKFPSFVLAFNSGWNDYSIRSQFSLFYYDEGQTPNYIGPVKIINEDETNLNTADELSGTFTELDPSFCSLGQTIEYYKKLREHLPNSFEDILFALRDSAFYTPILDKFERNSKFINSLIRYDDNERLLRHARFELFDYDLTTLYQFAYSFRPPYAKSSIDVKFNFSDDPILPNRIYAVIGKNGAGKTQLISSLPSEIAKENSDLFIPRVPLFSKIIAVSYSVFDQFEIPSRSSSFNYVYCGIRESNDEELSDRSLILRFHRAWKKVQELERINKWRNVLLNFIEEDILDLFIVELENPQTKNSYSVSIEGFHKAKKTLSSGQSIILYIITQVIANIRYDSLLIYDEPETHLHPNAITQLMNTIFELVNTFQSYCIIATHSPIIIRELFSKSVYVMERESNVPSIRKIGKESFGEDISVLTEEVFGNKLVSKQYKTIIERMVREGKSFEEISQLIEFDNIPLSLNTTLFIQSVLNRKK